MTEDSRKPRRSPARRILIGLGVALLLLVGVVVGLSFYLNSLTLPESLRTPSEEVLRQFRTESPTDANAAKREPALPAALDSSDSPNPQPGLTYEDYVRARMASGPNTAGGAIYLELVQQFTTELRKSYGESFQTRDNERSAPAHGFDIWVPGQSLSVEQTQFLIDHGDVIERFLRYIDAGGAPVPEPGEFHATSDHPPYGLNYVFFRVHARILAAEAQRLLEGGDAQGAIRLALSIYRLGEILVPVEPNIYALCAEDATSVANDSMRALIESGMIATESADALRSELDARARGLRPMDDYRSWMETQYRVGRCYLISMLEQPWWTLRDSGWRSHEIPENFFTWSLSECGKAFRSVANPVQLKLHSAAVVRNYDEMWISILNSFDHPDHTNVDPEEGPKRMAAILGADSPYVYFLPQLESGDGYSQSARLPRAGMNLNRATLDWIADARAEPPAAEEILADPLHPWRDPFTDHPLLVAPGESETVIWSVGPDRKDDQAAVMYDPTNGTTSAGDLVIRIPLNKGSREDVGNEGKP